MPLGIKIKKIVFSLINHRGTFDVNDGKG